MQQSWTKVQNYYRRNIARVLFRKTLPIRTDLPIISFTFDDFPRSAFQAGGSILNRYGFRGTYYVSLGLLGKDSPSGQICTEDDLTATLEQGHELGCHTFMHCHSWKTKHSAFTESIVQNRLALNRLFPGVTFNSMSYPISDPRPLTKRSAAKNFSCCRAGGQTLNTGTADLNQLSAYFLEKSRDYIQGVKELIDVNRSVRGWIIFATHDVAPDPSPFGCTPEFFEEVVEYASKSGARILPVARALEAIRGCKSSA